MENPTQDEGGDVKKQGAADTYNSTDENKLVAMIQATFDSVLSCKGQESTRHFNMLPYSAIMSLQNIGKDIKEQDAAGAYNPFDTLCVRCGDDVRKYGKKRLNYWNEVNFFGQSRLEFWVDLQVKEVKYLRAFARREAEKRRKYPPFGLPFYCSV